MSFDNNNNNIPDDVLDTYIPPDVIGADEDVTTPGESGWAPINNEPDDRGLEDLANQHDGILLDQSSALVDLRYNDVINDTDFHMYDGPERLPPIWEPAAPNLQQWVTDWIESTAELHPILRGVKTIGNGFDNGYTAYEITFKANDSLVGPAFLDMVEGVCAIAAQLVGQFIAMYYHQLPDDEEVRGFKVKITVECRFKKQTGIAAGNPLYEYKTFYKDAMLTYDGHIIVITSPDQGFKLAFNTALAVIEAALRAENVQHITSAYYFHTINKITVQLYRCRIFNGGVYIPTPDKIEKKKAVINPKVKEGCFRYAIMLALCSELMDELKARGSPEDKRVLHNLSEKYAIDRLFAMLPPEKKQVSFDGLPEQGCGFVPCREASFRAFCKANPTISLSVYAPAEKRVDVPIKPIYISPMSPVMKQVRLLYIPGGNAISGHYAMIRSFEKLICKIIKGKHPVVWCPFCNKAYDARRKRMCDHLARQTENAILQKAFYCERCMAPFGTKEELEYHRGMCLVTDSNYRVVQLPEFDPGLSFNDMHYEKKFKIATYMVADFESVLKPLNEHRDGTKETLSYEHLPCSYGIKVVSIFNELDEFILYTGKSPEDTIEHFCEDILKISTKVYKFYSALVVRHQEIPEERKAEYGRRIRCRNCLREFNPKINLQKVNAFNPITGEYLGVLCSACNKRIQLTESILPLVFHNARGYDLHHIIKEITKVKYDCTYNGIPQNSEKVMSFTILRSVQKRTISPAGRPIFKRQRTMCDIRIIDSLLFLLKSLESLTTILKRRNPDDFGKSFPILYNQMAKPPFELTPLQITATLEKNLYPYLWFSDYGKFDLPISEMKKLVDEDKREFFNDNPDDPDFLKSYNRKKDVFYHALEILGDKVKTVKDWANIYLAGDVLQLADILENARNLFMTTHHLDILHYYGAPGYSWDAFLYSLKGSEILPPHLFCKGEMNFVCFFMRGIRGGCSGIMKRYAKANNKFMGDKYDPTKPSSFLIYLDANNLYGWAMQQKLPCDDFKWIENPEGLNQRNIFAYLDDLEKNQNSSAFLEVKLSYPKELHDKHNLYPLAPERRTIKGEYELSEYQRDLNKRLNYKINVKTPMLMQTLEDKDHYFLHSRNLQLYIGLGMKLEKVYSGVRFKEDYVMRDYIQLNTDLRNKSGNTDFEKELYKLLNNSIYGKTLENPMKYSILTFINSTNQFDEAVAKPGFEGSVFQQDNFMIAKMKHETVEYRKPLYLGASITEYAKFLMFHFYYAILQEFYGWEKVNLLFTDTDSLMLEIFTEDIFADIAEINRRFDCPIDVSSFDPEVVKKYHILTKNNKRIGAFKSETGSEIIYDFVGLRSKMYSYRIFGKEDEQHMRAKGVSKSAIRYLSHENYQKCLDAISSQDARQPIEMKNIRSRGHHIYSVVNEKFGLSSNDTKRYILPDKINTLAYGHYKIAEMQQPENGSMDLDEI